MGQSLNYTDDTLVQAITPAVVLLGKHSKYNSTYVSNKLKTNNQLVKSVTRLRIIFLQKKENKDFPQPH